MLQIPIPNDQITMNYVCIRNGDSWLLSIRLIQQILYLATAVVKVEYMVIVTHTRLIKKQDVDGSSTIGDEISGR